MGKSEFLQQKFCFRIFEEFGPTMKLGDGPSMRLGRWGQDLYKNYYFATKKQTSTKQNRQITR